MFDAAMRFHYNQGLFTLIQYMRVLFDQSANMNGFSLMLNKCLN
jgi:hypothetical protein